MLALALLPAQLGAQGITAGFSAGLSLANLTGDDADEDLDSRTGFNAGAFVDFPIGEIIGVSTGLYYVQKGFSDDVGDVELGLDYLEVPILLRVTALGGDDAVGVNLFLGPTLAFEIGCEADFEGFGSVDCDEDDEFPTKGFDLGLAFGAGVTFPVSDAMSLFGTAIYDFGLRSIDDSGVDFDIKNETVLLDVGVAFRLGG